MSSKKELSLEARSVLRRLNQRTHIAISDSGEMGEIDFKRFAPIIDSEIFQRQRYKKQLANAHTIFPGATHSRLEHALDAATRQVARGRFLVRYGMITPDDADHLTALILTHDQWHGPYSHVLDRVVSIDHDARAAKEIVKQRREFERCSFDVAKLQALFREENPQYKIVKHHPLGTDKWSYLNLDAERCKTGRLDLRRLPQYVYWLDDELMVDITCLDEAIDLKWFYIKMYRDVYLKKACLIGQRVIEKEIHYLLSSGRLSEEILWELTDDGLAGQICSTERGKKGFDRYRYRCSKCVVAFRVNDFGRIEKTGGKKLKVFEKDASFLDALSAKEHASPGLLEKKERELAKELQIDPLDLDIVPPMSRFRFAPPPIWIVDGGEAILDTELYPENHRAMEERARAYTVLRVCVTERLRGRIYKKAGLINEFFDDWVREIEKSA